MSAKRYQFKVIEANDTAELEGQLRDAGAQQWSAVGYGVLPEGRRSVLMQRKVKMHHPRHRDSSAHIRDDREERPRDEGDPRTE